MKLIDKSALVAEIEKLKSNLIHGACSSQVAMETRCKEEAYNEVLAIINYEQREPVCKVWHDMKEDAEDGRNIIIIDPKDFYGAVLRKGGSQLKNHNKERYLKWAYIDDIINVIKKKEEPIRGDFEMALTEMIDKAQKCVVEPWVVAAQWKDELVKLAKDEEPVSDDLGEYINKLSKQFQEVSFAKLSRIAVRVAKWQKEQDQSTIELAEDHAMLAGMEKMKEEIMAKAVEVTVHIEAGNYPYIPQIELYDYDKDVPSAKEGDKYKVVLIKED